MQFIVKKKTIELQLKIKNKKITKEKKKKPLNLNDEPLSPHQMIQAMTLSSMMIVVRKGKTIMEISRLVFLVKIFIK
jgi:hypothetical protein